MSNNELGAKHSDLLYDYIKFHLGLYIATPPVLAIVATALGRESHPTFQMSMFGLVVVYFVAGVHASWTIARHINVEWKDDVRWIAFGKGAKSPVRRFLHHYLYWIGLIIGLGGLASARF